MLLSERFAEVAPAEVYATLLDEGTYLCSERTMYRILREARVPPIVPRPRKPRAKPTMPVLAAMRPNQIWSWDITMLRSRRRAVYFPLYVVLDLYSRYVVAWLVARRESGDLAERLINDACVQQHIRPGQLTLHSDRGPAMRSQSVAQLLATLGITRSLARPRVSNDNPYSEAQFATHKCHRTFPTHFDSLEHAMAHCRDYFDWYNHHHRHSGIALLTPATVHHGRDQAMLEKRSRVLEDAYTRHPERFVARPPHPGQLPDVVGINWPGPKPKKRNNELSQSP